MSNLSRSALQLCHKPGIRCRVRACTPVMPLITRVAMPSVVLARRLSCDPTRCAAALLPAPGLFALFCADWLAPPPRLRTCPSCSDAASCRPRACTRVRSRAAPRARSSSRCVILPVRTLVPCPSQTLPVHPVTGASSSPPSSEVGEPLLMRVGEVAFVAPPHRWHGCPGGHKRQPCYVARLLGQHPTAQRLASGQHASGGRGGHLH